MRGPRRHFGDFADRFSFALEQRLPITLLFTPRLPAIEDSYRTANKAAGVDAIVKSHHQLNRSTSSV